MERCFLCFFTVVFFPIPIKFNPTSPGENQNDLELDFKVFFFVDSCC